MHYTIWKSTFYKNRLCIPLEYCLGFSFNNISNTVTRDKKKNTRFWKLNCIIFYRMIVNILSSLICTCGPCTGDKILHSLTKDHKGINTVLFELDNNLLKFNLKLKKMTTWLSKLSIVYSDFTDLTHSGNNSFWVQEKLELKNALLTLCTKVRSFPIIVF